MAVYREKREIDKVVRIGTIPTNGLGGRRASVYIHIKNRQGYPNQKDDLSLTGVIGPLPSGNALGGCGQIDMDFKHAESKDDNKEWGKLITPEEIKFAKRWDLLMWFHLLDTWKKYHLKDAESVPKKEMDFLESLPDSDKKPAWV